MASLHVHLTAGHPGSPPHIPATLDPQMRVFFQRNLDPFDCSLSATDLLRAAGNLLRVARSGLSWASQFFAAPPFSPPRKNPKGGEAVGNEKEGTGREGEKGAGPKSKTGAEGGTAPPCAPDKEAPTKERVRRTREAARAAAAEARERFRQAPQAPPSEKPPLLADLPRDYGLHLALEVAIDRSRKPKNAEKEAERPQGAPTIDPVPASPLSGLSFHGSVSIHLPLGRSLTAARRGGKER